MAGWHHVLQIMLPVPNDMTGGVGAACASQFSCDTAGKMAVVKWVTGPMAKIPEIESKCLE